MSEWHSHFARIAADMDCTRACDGATIGYDVFADGSLWSDEYPASAVGRSEEFMCLRILLRYRTSVLMGTPEPSLAPIWREAKDCFPHWAGFEPRRQEPSADVIGFFEKARRRDMRFIERL